MRRSLVVSICAFLLGISGTGVVVESAHIVFYHSLASLSHRVSTQPLANALLAKGHNVTYLSSVMAIKPNPSIKDIIPQQLKTYIEDIITADFDVQNRIDGDMPFMPYTIPQYNYKSCELTVSDPQVQNWLASNPQVDLILTDFVHECAVGLSYALDAKVGIINTLGYWPKYSDLLGSPDETSAMGSWVVPFSNGYKPIESFMSRVANALLPVFELFMDRFVYEPQYAALFKKYLPASGDIPDMRQLEQRIDIILQLGNFLNEHPRSVPPMVLNVPGIHVTEEVGPLQEDIEEFIHSNSSKGFVYISLGTVARASKLPQGIKDAFMNSIRAFPEIRFLWRWDGDLPTEIPDNLYVSRWFKQQDVLGHPECKGFVTQVGRPSMQEAISRGVPMIALPVLGDQDYNALRIEETGTAVKLELSHLTQADLSSAIHKILYDDKIRNTAAYQSQLFKDLPMKPLDTAVWWTEYILRHKDVSHLKPVGRSQTWYQRRQLDSWMFILLVASICVTVICGTSVHIYNWISQWIVYQLSSKKVKKS